MQHPNAKLTARGRLELVLLVEREGASFRQAAASFNCSVSTAFEWVSRWRRSSISERLGLGCLADRSSRPHRQPRRLDALTQARIVLARRRTGWGPRLIAGELGMAHATVWKVLHRHGLSRPGPSDRPPVHRYEWPCPGDLLHMDTKRYARFERPGHALTGDRRKTGAEKRAGWGYQYAHAIVDDHSRLAYVELHDDQRADTVTAFTARALAWFTRRGIRTRRVMTDGAWAYTRNRSLADLLDREGVRHLVTRPYRPQTNGKVERFHQTMAREWGYGVLYRSHRHRQRALRYWLGHYNQRRPHSALGGQAPISRVRNLCEHDT
jgi:transposase InsO family protein